jgi:DNA-binding transcriptional ArsR family regulator
MGPLDHRRLFAAAVFLASTTVLAIQVINPSPITVTLGEGGTEVAELGSYFRYRDVAVVAVAACLLGASGTYLLTAGRSPTVGGDRDRDTRVQRERVEQPAPASTDGGNDLAPSDELLDARRQEWEETADRLANNEHEIYEVLLAADGVLPQSDIVDETDLSKATVSRTLDSLETKNLVERKRRGMGNVVLLL